MPRKRNKAKIFTVLITAGPTQEPLDPVRYLSNRSSGKMGYALAEAAHKKGHAVILISGPTIIPQPKGVKIISVETAKQMYKAVFKYFKKADVIIKTAAVADYHPAIQAKQKIKKEKNTLMLRLVKNPDILKELGRKKNPNQILVGFAAETEHLIQNAKKKLIQKNCDWIVANRVGKKETGFNSDWNQVTLISKTGRLIRLQKTPKKKLAPLILKKLGI